MRQLLLAGLFLLTFSGISFGQHGRSAAHNPLRGNNFGWNSYYNGGNYISPGYRFNSRTGRSSVRYGPSTFSYYPGYIPAIPYTSYGYTNYPPYYYQENNYYYYGY